MEAFRVNPEASDLELACEVEKGKYYHLKEALEAARKGDEVLQPAVDREESYET